VNEQLAPIPAHVAPVRVINYDFWKDPGLRTDLYGTVAKLREMPDLFYTPCNQGHWVATRADVIATILKTPELFSNFPYLIPKSAGSPVPTPITETDAPVHTEYRRVIMQHMTPKTFDAMEGSLRGLFADLIKDVRAKGSCDFVSEVGQIIPVDVFLNWLDLPREHRAQFLQWAGDQLRNPDPLVRRQAKLDSLAYLRSFAAQREANPGNDLISALLQTPFRGRRMTLDELMPLIGTLFNAGLDTVTSNMSFMMRFLAEHPGHRRQLIEDPSLISNAIEEMMRFLTTANLARCCSRDTEINGVTLKAGEQILIPFVLYGLDERMNPDPMKVDFKRQNPTHLAFGLGPHFCAGTYLARMELRILIQEWLKLIPHFAIKEGAQIETSGGVVFGVRSLPLVWGVA
jgi:cytochrome P450